MSRDPNQPAEQPLGTARRGFVGILQHLDPSKSASSLTPDELERQLIEMGFVEGARIEILHQGAIGLDPIAVRVDNNTIALRRSEAMAIIVR